MGQHESGAVLGATVFSDLTLEEFQALPIRGLTESAASGLPSVGVHEYNGETLAASVDWTTKGAVTPIKNQGQCGSCWAFSTTGGAEGQNFLVNNKLSSFSEQELVDCAGAEGNQGCNGGLMDDGFQFVEDHGLCFESAYPYKGVGGTCEKTTCTSQVTVTSYTDIPQGDTD